MANESIIIRGVKKRQAFLKSIGVISEAGQIPGCQCRAAHTMELTMGNDNAHEDDLEAKPKQTRSSKKICF